MNMSKEASVSRVQPSNVLPSLIRSDNVTKTSARKRKDSITIPISKAPIDKRQKIVTSVNDITNVDIETKSSVLKRKYSKRNVEQTAMPQNEDPSGFDYDDDGTYTNTSGKSLLKSNVELYPFLHM